LSKSKRKSIDKTKKVDTLEKISDHFAAVLGGLFKESVDAGSSRLQKCVQNVETYFEI
jgi:hypothetical protein